MTHPILPTVIVGGIAMLALVAVVVFLAWKLWWKR
jgi:hypothetical protein